MDTSKRAEIISVGTELLRGEITDTNAGFLAAQLPLLGIELQRITTTGDDLEQLRRALSRAQQDADIILLTGGLGPTEDDLTREAIAAVVGEEPVIDPTLADHLRKLFSHLKRGMSPQNIKQAWLIPSAAALPNPRGTAPGWWVEKDGKTIVAMPGPPREMTVMWREQVVPRLKDRLPDRVIASRTLKTYGIPEAEVSGLVQPFFTAENPELGIYAKPDGIHLRLIARGENAEKLLKAAEAKLEMTFGSRIWGRDEDTLEGLIGAQLIKEGLTLATVENGTAGLVANRLRAVPESEQFYRGGLVMGTDADLSACGVLPEIIYEFGVISAEVATVMAAAVRERYHADIGLSTGAVAKEPGSESLPAGLTYVAISDASGEKTWAHNFARFRDASGQREAVGALFRLREWLLKR